MIVIRQFRRPCGPQTVHPLNINSVWQIGDPLRHQLRLPDYLSAADTQCDQAALFPGPSAPQRFCLSTSLCMLSEFE